MVFNSLTFFAFFTLLVPAYFLVPYKQRWMMLLAANYFFYCCCSIKYSLLLLCVTILSYCIAIVLQRLHSSASKKLLLALGVALNISILIAFKYIALLVEAVQIIADLFPCSFTVPAPHILVPVGISFYVFRTTSYIIDIYRGTIRPEKHFGVFALYVSFFPCLLAGPIDRAKNLLPQFYRKHAFDVDRICLGLQLMLWGLFKKVVIADRLALYVDKVHSNLEMHSGPTLIVAMYFYAIQIYCDFSGYTDMASGCARVLGFKINRNFNLPYFSPTIGEFWRRWHISLSTWFRDYVYIPIGGSRAGANRTHINLFITMGLCGLWHGAAWNFIFWGLLHGLLLSLSRLTLRGRDTLCATLRIPDTIRDAVRIAVTFHVVAVLWIFFRAATIGEALYIISHFFSGWPDVFTHAHTMEYGIIGIVILVCVEAVQRRKPIRSVLGELPLAVRWLAYYAMIFLIVLFGVDGGSQFIYFQF